MKVPFSRPYFTEQDLDEILANMRKVLVSGWLTSGKNVELLEEEFAAQVGTKYAVAVNSCTAGLHAMMVAHGIKTGDEVIAPTDTFVATANTVLYTGAKPVFADSDPETFNVSPQDVERKITKKTKAMVAVHLAGNPCDMKTLGQIAEDNDIALFEDCAHAHGAKFNGTSCGTFGEAAAFSFYATKIMTTGEGGIVTTNDEKMAQRLRRIRSHGRGGVGPVETTELGFNYRMPDIEAVIGLSQLKHLADFVRQRQRTARFYNDVISEHRWAKPQRVRDGDVCSYYVYLFKLAKDTPIEREELARKLADKGIGTSVLYYPVHTQPFYKKLLAKEPKCPVAVELGKRTLALPMYNGMTETELENVGNALREIWSSPVEQIARVN